MYMAISNAWSVSIASRGNYGNNTNFLPNEGSYFSVGGFDSLSDCATACDTDNQCTAFSASPDGGQSGKYVCSLYNQQVTMSGNPGTTYAKTKSASTDGLIMGNSIAPTAIDPGSGQIMASARDRGCGGNRQIDNSGHGGPCGAGQHCCVQYGYDAKACPIKGSIITVEQDYTNYTTNYSSGSDWSRAPKVVCGYKNLDSGWLNDNIQNLDQYFDDKNSKLAGLQWCNNLSVSDLYQNMTKCQGYATSASDYRSFLLNRLQGSQWYTDPNAPDIVLGTSCGAGDVSVNSQCQSIIGNIPRTIPGSSLIDGMNQAITNGSSQVQGAIADTVSAICSTNSGNNVCACYNVYTQGLEGCAKNPNLPGCNSSDVQAAVRGYNLVSSQSDAQSKALLAQLTTMDNDTLDAFQVCITAENSGSNVMLPRKRPGNSLNINQCISNPSLTGASVTNSQFLAQCNINQSITTGGPSTIPSTSSDGTTTNSSGGTTTNSSGGTTTNSSGGTTTTPPYWVWIVLAICLCVMLMGGIYVMKRKPS